MNMCESVGNLDPSHNIRPKICLLLLITSRRSGIKKCEAKKASFVCGLLLSPDASRLSTYTTSGTPSGQSSVERCKMTRGIDMCESVCSSTFHPSFAFLTTQKHLCFILVPNIDNDKRLSRNTNPTRSRTTLFCLACIHHHPLLLSPLCSIAFHHHCACLSLLD